MYQAFNNNEDVCKENQEVLEELVGEAKASDLVEAIERPLVIRDKCTSNPSILTKHYQCIFEYLSNVLLLFHEISYHH